MKSPMSAKVTIESYFASISSFFKPRMVAFIYMFCLPVKSGLNPAPSSRSAEIFPFTVIVPFEGKIIPHISCNSVDLPLPFFPIIPRNSPFLTVNETLSSAKKGL